MVGVYLLILGHCFVSRLAVQKGGGGGWVMRLLFRLQCLLSSKEKTAIIALAEPGGLVLRQIEKNIDSKK